MSLCFSAEFFRILFGFGGMLFGFGGMGVGAGTGAEARETELSSMGEARS
jgi:hypothetical protein